MVNLAICTVLCSMISIVMRLGRNRVSSTLNMMAVNYVTCILVAGALMGFPGRTVSGWRWAWGW